MDLLDWQPPTIVPALDPDRTRSGTLRGRIARVVSQVLYESSAKREAIADRMSEFLGEEVSLAMLNNYASQAKEEHTISAIRLAALCHATSDLRPLQVLAEVLDYAVIPTRYLPAIEAEIKGDKADELRRQADELSNQAQLARRQWKGPR